MGIESPPTGVISILDESFIIYKLRNENATATEETRVKNV